MRRCHAVPARTGPRSAEPGSVPDLSRHSFKEVIRGLLDPTKGMMQNKLKLTKGNMPTMVKFVTASKELVESTSRVPTKFVDE